jgi:tetratricopeptide (TPR) repeat protein
LDDAKETVLNRTLQIVTLSAATLVLFLGYSGVVNAQEEHKHMHEPAEQLGQVTFKVSCNPSIQRQFNRAVAWLHSFEYDEAEKAFTEITIADPRCGMGYWGIAMSNNHPLWVPPTAAELQKGSSAVEKAKAAGAGTERERNYIAAVDAFYKDADKLDHRTRTFAYCEAMKQLYLHNASDREAGVFYALALITTGTMAHDKSYAREKEAAEILNRVLAVQPLHPGVAHYLIHGYDYPALAHLALPAARSYAKIAPASAHAQHMPSHIFTRLGLWQEAIKSNLDARASAKAYALRHHLSGTWDEQFHAMDYLVYAYLQGAQDKLAQGVLDDLHRIQRAEPETFKVAYAYTAIPARYVLERKRWDEAAKLTLPQDALGTFPWQRFRWAEANIHFARAIGAARSGDAAAAREAVAKLAAIQLALFKSQEQLKGDYDWAKQIDIERQIAAAWLAESEGNHEAGLRLMRAAADLDDETDKHPVTPGAILPAREQLGELLIELKQPAEALKEFEAALRNAPNRFSGLYGAAHAARQAGDLRQARTYYEKLMILCHRADSSRPEIDEAKTFLASANTAPARRRTQAP